MYSLKFLLAVAVTVTLILLADCSTATSSLELATNPAPSLLKPLSVVQGIVVPKRSALIVGLNQQFKLKADNQKASGGQVAGTAGNQQLGQTGANSTDSGQTNNSKSSSIFAANFGWLNSRVHLANKRRFQQQHNLLGSQTGQQPNGLYLDRHQQEILAANPNLLNPSNLPAGALFTRSDAPSSEQRQQSLASGNLTLLKLQQQQLEQSAANNQQLVSSAQQLYRGFSLIELEVKTEADRRYIQELYGNLSAALNEQAQNPNALTVSPYADIDFWSFKYALNDQIDIMVSPKSRAFILGQLGRAKIRHRIKIDDIQSRLDQQLAVNGGTNSANSASAQAQQVPALGKSSDGQLSARAGHSNGHQSDAGGGAAANSNSRQAPDGPANGQTQAAGRVMNESVFFDNYQRLADINQYLESIVEKNRDVAQVKVIGRSSQGRYLRVLKLGYEQQDVDGSTLLPVASNSQRLSSSDSATGSRPPSALNNATYILDSFFTKQQSVQKLGSIWLDGGTHAREWISPSTVLYIAFRLSDNHNRCMKFFDTMRVVVGQANSMAATTAAASLSTHRTARRYYGPPPAHSPPPPSSSLDADLILGINEINTSLLGKPVQHTRPRTELEHTLELLAKSPQEVASEYGCDLDMEQLLRRYTFYVMPVLNPDGYEYSHTHNRLWRKTRSTSNHPIYRHFCLGADPNRNYDARHGATGSSTHPCSQTYAGTVPFTEPETRHQSNFVYANRIGMKMFISFHSYSQMILLPYSHSKQLPPDYKDLESVGQAAVKAIERTHGTLYRVGPSANILYTASGTASDWAYEKAGVKYSYTIELRDTGNYGFLLPRQQIIPTGEETFNGLMAMIAQMEKNDNLLTSKSLMLSLKQAATNETLEGQSNSDRTANFGHVPIDMNQVQTFNKHRSRPPLENVLDGSDTWAAPDPGPSGVRDRRPVGSQTYELVGSRPVMREHEHEHEHNPPDSGHQRPSDAFEAPSVHRLDEEPISEDNEPDSGYAFEGEGELMEPTRENMIEAAKLSNLRMSGRQEHAQRIVQAASLTASGRSSINSPLLTSRSTPSAPKRESSDNLQGIESLR